MAFDGIVTKAIVTELSELTGARIDTVFEPNKNEIILGLYSKKLLAKCLKPSQKAIEPPLETTSKNPKVHS